MHEDAGARLRQAVLDHWPPMTLRAFAEKVGTRPDMLSGYIHGSRIPPRGFWSAAEKELGLREGELSGERVAA